ncbi:TPA: LOW QUALITY PROTEIN: hypothetical protein N0F65_010411 [Lagenidium giganteum]|uniref:pantothenate kinase n=1 Tax=Lagenidium giganteum TaxID=4803 RepID=A0AAV2YVJ3_9STRA|nr:TPA: LOW QUALITY PROTEIN: hypothetical protein N0F65_010411 [Lagenidium giganteum]
MREMVWTQIFLFGASCVAGFIIARKRKLHRFHLHILSSKSYDYGRFFGMDVGGTLAKMVFFQPTSATLRAKAFRGSQTVEESMRSIEDFLTTAASGTTSDTFQREERLTLDVDELGGTIHFFSFQTNKMEEIVDFVRYRFFHRYIKNMPCTGGGAVDALTLLFAVCDAGARARMQFCRLFEEKLGIRLEKTDEMDALIKGLNFVLQHSRDECYRFKDVDLGTQGLGTATKKIVPTPPPSALYPFLLVNIGSGVSILKVSGPHEYERVSGTSLGGGTFWGLCRTMSKLRSFDAAMDASVEGNSNHVDMTVGDIYGAAGYEPFNLKSTTVASSFGKMGAKQLPNTNAPVHDEDLARSLLFMITQNIGQVAYLNARRVDTKRIYFCGNFLRRNEIALRQLAYAIDFWSGSEMEAQFFHHEGFFGSLGTFLTQFEAATWSASTAAATSEQQASAPDDAGTGRQDMRSTPPAPASDDTFNRSDSVTRLPSPEAV